MGDSCNAIFLAKPTAAKAEVMAPGQQSMGGGVVGLKFKRSTSCAIWL
jgi:hypothetical protein